MCAFKEVKKAIVDAQLASTPKAALLNDVAQGAVVLLSANDIIRSLGISAKAFEQLVGLPNHYLQSDGVNNATSLFEQRVELVNRELESVGGFPKPDLYVLGKARWAKSTFKKWLDAQCG